jgi:hypothetical protein
MRIKGQPSGWPLKFFLNMLVYFLYARLAQLVRAPRLHRGGPGFESLSVHPA